MESGLKRFIHIVIEDTVGTLVRLNINNCKHMIHISVLVIILVVTFIILPVFKTNN